MHKTVRAVKDGSVLRILYQCCTCKMAVRTIHTVGWNCTYCRLELYMLWARYGEFRYPRAVLQCAAVAEAEGPRQCFAVWVGVDGSEGRSRKLFRHASRQEDDTRQRGRERSAKHLSHTRGSARCIGYQGQGEGAVCTLTVAAATSSADSGSG